MNKRRSLALVLFCLTSFALGNETPCVGQTERNIGLPGITFSVSPERVFFKIYAKSDPNVFSDDVMFAGFVTSEEVRKEIELTDQQIDSLEDFYLEQQQYLDEKYPAIHPDDLDVVLQTEMTNVFDRLVSNYVIKTEEILLPFQVSRLKQIARSRIAEKRSFLEMLRSPEISDRIELTGTQDSELVLKNKTLEKEMLEKLAEIQKEYRRTLISDLSNTQQEEIRQLFGEDFFETDK